jgi:hypothetical protein
MFKSGRISWAGLAEQMLRRETAYVLLVRKPGGIPRKTKTKVDG